MKFNDLGKCYDVLEHIATGGMAEIYRAIYHSSSGFSKEVILKKVLSDKKDQKKWISAFKDEVNVLSKLHHSNIVHVYDFGQAAFGTFISMEFVDGGTLHDVKRVCGPLDKSIVMYVGLEILKGLSYAHRKGILHRDLSLANILVSKEGEIKIADFGISKEIADAAIPTTVVKGKRAYMSPEQFERKPLTKASDIYSVGVILSELLGGSIAEGSFLSSALEYSAEKRLQTAESLEAVLTKEWKKGGKEWLTQRDFSLFLNNRGVWEERNTETIFPFQVKAELPALSWRRFFPVSVLVGISLLLGGMTPNFLTRGYISLNAKPWGSIYINNRYVGETPLFKHHLPDGKHRIVITNRIMKKEKELMVHVSANELQTRFVNFQ